ncbi:hypothetical protein BCJMU51_p404 (plasmid) [Bacillus cereus]|uniref:hypothetical protein n=1 Tax=Bacillus cereus TaxID=1396 RepID=UPI001F1DD85C|nr:hypothetical protein [Bacillus cereus]BCC03726.1 hypothetical protein BCM0057_p204 [Bacillus cereus]BCC27246.1 hypothetical protein BCM0079_p202 [Bacillus cereus]BCC38810.1 hypothetical protein BCM0105_p304 [Bacillus cereus]BCC74276.1 hypothetical protein BCJMU51_p404 [Bacillus cereus]BCC86038.1 hypothetical protein BCJMU75_p202 [Bacillus cereus]
MSEVSMETVIKGKQQSELLKHLEKVGIELLGRRDELLEQWEKEGLKEDSIFEDDLKFVEELMNRNDELMFDVKVELITTMDEIHHQKMGY